MVKLVWDEGFKRSYRRNIKNNGRLRKKFWTRVVFKFAKGHKEVLLIDMGSHNEIY